MRGVPHAPARAIVRRSLDGPWPDLGDLPPLLARLYALRGVREAGEIDHRLTTLPPPAALRGIEEAVALVATALERGERIVVVGDFDADGATSSALALLALRAMGAEAVEFIVPNRFEYGYGLTPEIVEVAARHRPDLLITVDNGIASIDGVAAARVRGWKVVVTDHHLPGERLPEADAIVNPNQPGCAFPSRNLAGVGVIFYLMLALRAHLRQRGWFGGRRAEPNLAELLDLVALGTVADVVRLDHVNRTLVAQGLARIRAGRCRPGIRALLEVAGRAPERLVAADLAFAVGPRLNAAGRLDDMATGIRCLLTGEREEALELARQLDRLNRQRREIEREMEAEALAGLDALGLDPATAPAGLCLYEPHWHQGVVGILASRLKERYHRPVIAFAADEAGGRLKGSARSVAGLHIRDAIDAVATRHPGLVTRFGGHAMAAGLTLPEEHFDPFRRAFEEEVARLLGDDAGRATLLSDGELAAAELTLETAEQIRAGGPWGQGFPEPLFDGEFELVSRRIVGERHLKMVVAHPAGGTIDAIAFHTTDCAWPPRVGRVALAYRPDVNEYRGQRSLQLLVEQVVPVP